MYRNDKHNKTESDMKRIGESLYTYKGYTVDGYEANTGLDWRVIDNNGDWVLSLPTKRDCKSWIDQNGGWLPPRITL